MLYCYISNRVVTVDQLQLIIVAFDEKFLHAFLLPFWKYICNFSDPAERIMLTGRHWVRDVSCKRCNTKLGWMYELAAEDDQRYKEAKVILEKALVREKDGIQECQVTD